jgi:ribokinase
MRYDVLVAGSLHLDIMVAADRLPQLDETLMGSGWALKTGGKGGNQAVAAASQGATVAMLGAVGDDDFGRRLLAGLDAGQVDRRCVSIEQASNSGMSVAIQDQRGDYAAVVVSGVNHRVSVPEVLPEAAVLLLQNEIPETVNLAVAKRARAQGTRIVLNAAPARLIGASLAELIDLLVVNRVEAGMMAAGSVNSIDDAIAILPRLAPDATDVIVTLGGDGFVIREQGQKPRHVPALPVDVVSSHGAGDCFCGVLAAGLARGASLADAATQAGVAAARFVAGHS